MIGTTISHYHILEKLGEGGMGVVYKAQDTKLDRTVALKFLPDHVSAGSGELERFVQEAKSAAGLNHPNICTIYGIEESNGKNFIAMEFVDGQTLQEKKSSLSMKQALDVGIQIAEGLAAAHEKGIVHRDIKPENIMFRKDGRVQIMDFGLAKLRGASRLTKEGSTVGTAGYMSPEQIQGQDTDNRSDIFSLGVLLYEMLTGQAPFKGMHETAIAYEIVNVDSAPMSSLKPEIPPELDAIVLECLEKDPKERTQSAGQVAVDLKRYRRESSRSRASRITAARPVQSGARSAAGGDISSMDIRTSPSWRATGLIALGALILGGVATMLIPTSEPSRPVIRAALTTSAGLTYNDGQGGNSAISPDGSMVVFSGRDSSGTDRLYIRLLATNEIRPLRGTEGAKYPFWSPDNKQVGCFLGGALQITSAGGGPVVSIANAPFGRGAAWSSNGTIVFQPRLQEPNLYAISAGGGEVRPATDFDSTMKAFARFPSFLPDGDHFLFGMITLESNETSIYMGSVSGRQTRKIIDDGYAPLYADGKLMFVRQQILMARRFDPSSPLEQSAPITVQGDVNIWLPRAKADVSASTTGLILYSGATDRRSSEDAFIWINDAGTVQEEITVTNLFGESSLSNDGTRFVFGQGGSTGGVDVWTYDSRRKVKTRMTFTGPVNAATSPVWSPDGRFVYYNSEELGGKAAVFRRAADGSGKADLVADGGRDASSGYYPLDVSPDGKRLLIAVRNELQSSLGLVDLTAAQLPAHVDVIVQDGDQARFSPDGAWIVYTVGITSETRTVVVSKVGSRSGTWQVSSPDGYYPVWVGNRIIYRSPLQSEYMVSNVAFRDGSPVFDQPQRLFPRSAGNLSQNMIIGYSKSKKAFAAYLRSGYSANGQLSLIINWPGLVEEQNK